MEVGIVRLIILSAFNGRLKSEILEWPDWPLDIQFPFMGKDLDTNITYLSLIHICNTMKLTLGKILEVGL